MNHENNSTKKPAKYPNPRLQRNYFQVIIAVSITVATGVSPS